MTTYSPQWKEKIIQPVYNSQDIEYFQGMYPQQIKELQKYVIQHCDTMDYAGSPIYDEYPDPLMLDRACDAICQKLPLSQRPDWPEEEKAEAYEAAPPQVEAMEWNGPNRRPAGGPPPWGPPGPPPGGPPPWGPPGPPAGGPPPWSPPGPPPGSPPPGGSLISDVIKVLLMNELQRRRCRTGMCR